MSNEPIYLQLCPSDNRLYINPGATVRISTSGWVNKDEHVVAEQGLIYLDSSFRGKTIKSLFVTEVISRKEHKWKMRGSSAYIGRDRRSDDPVRIDLVKS